MWYCTGVEVIDPSDLLRYAEVVVILIIDPSDFLDLYNIALCCTRTILIYQSAIQRVGSQMLVNLVFIRINLE